MYKHVEHFEIFIFSVSTTLFSTESPSSEPLTGISSETDGETERTLPRSHSERLLTISKEHVQQERELREKYHDSIYNTAEKVIQASQNSQLKALRVQFERETSDVMRKLQDERRDEVKALAKKHRNREELGRVKREVAKGVVEKGVAERVKLGQNYELKREELQKQHESVRLALGEHRNKVIVCRSGSVQLLTFWFFPGEGCFV